MSTKSYDDLQAEADLAFRRYQEASHAALAAYAAASKARHRLLGWALRQTIKLAANVRDAERDHGLALIERDRLYEAHRRAHQRLVDAGMGR